MQSKLKSIVSRFKNKKIVVWGDLILDEYVLYFGREGFA